MLALPRSHTVYPVLAASSGDWPTYMHDNKRNGDNRAESIINRTSSPGLKVHWTAQSGGWIFSQPIVANGIIYWGSFDGYEHATDGNGHQLWQQYLGVTTQCTPVPALGIVSSAAVATISLNGTPTSVVFVGGGDDHLYALDALSGTILWSTLLGNPSMNTFIWDSPLVFDNKVYIGIGTTGEGKGCALIPGQFFALDALTGTILHTYNTVPPGCAGAGIWSSPTFDPSDGSIYLTAGTQGKCSNDTISIGIVKLRASDLSYKSSWQIPLDQRLTNDADFGATPTLFTATIEGTLHKLVGAVDKNGVYYAFERTSLSSGPVWQRPIAIPGACPECGQGSISSSAWDGTRLYVAGGNTTINGVSCKGSVQALNPADGTVIWQACMAGVVMGAVSAVPGVVAVINGGHVSLLHSATGATLFTYSALFYGSPSISNGVLYVGSRHNLLYAFGT
ncbi:MAG: PQQ-binding-like beta-propeller repeat protein [Ktedonobacteraceae bacterium]